MSTLTAAEVKKQILELQRTYEQLVSKERLAVIARIKEAMASYDIKLSELAGSPKPAPARKQEREYSTSKIEGRHPDARPGRLYRSPRNGLTWDGTGRKPEWLLKLIRKGHSIAEYEVKKSTQQKKSKSAQAHPGYQRKGPRPIRYRDSDGHEWSGWSRVPGWIVEHEAKGGSREDFRVKDSVPSSPAQSEPVLIVG